MVWAWMAASGMGSLILVNDGTHDGSSRSSLEVYWKILFARNPGNDSQKKKPAIY